MPLQTRFLLSATSESQFPASRTPEIAFLGRSNVGKSSLINAILGQQAAKVSSTPGRTRAINFFESIEPGKGSARFMIADLPGYGYAKLSKSISAQWPQFINPYLASRVNLAVCICLIDSNIPVQASDVQLFEALHGWRRRFLIVGTKADRLSGNQRTNALAKLKKELEVEDILLCSAKTGYGVKEIWNSIREIAS